MTLSKKDNRIGRAINLGILNNSLTRRGSVGRLDNLDFFKFSTSSSSSFSVSLTGLRGNVDLFLLNGRGRTIASSRKPKTKPEAITGVVGGGTYYLKLQSRTTLASTPYRVSLSAAVAVTPPPVTPPPGVLVKTATLTQFTTVPGSITRTIVNGDTTFFKTADPNSGEELIYVYRNNALQRLTNSSTRNILEDTHGSRAVWSSDLSTVGRELFLYDGNTTRQLTNSISDTPEFLDMDGSRVFWLNIKPGGLKELYVNDGTQNILLGTNVFLPIDQLGSSYVIEGKFQGLETEPSNTSVVWQAFGGSDGGFDRELFLFDGNVGQTIQLTADNIDNNFLGNNGSNIVFSTSSGFSLYKSTSRQIAPIPNSNSAFIQDRRLQPAISGENVVFSRNLVGLFFFNGTTTQQITNANVQVYFESLSGSNVVFRRIDGVTDFELFFFNGTTGGTTQITQRLGIDSPNTDNETVLHQDGSNVFWAGGGKVYVTNGITGNRKEVSGLAQAEFGTSYVGSDVIWQKRSEVFFYDGVTGETNKIVSDAYDQSIKVFPKRTIGAYVTWRNNAGDLFIYDSNSKTTTLLGNRDYELVSISGSRVTLQRGKDFFYTNV